MDSRTTSPQGEETKLPYKRALFIEFDGKLPVAAVYQEDGKEVMRCQIQDATPSTLPIAPDGWKLVPVEPTDEMLRAGSIAFHNKSADIASPAPTEHPEDGGGPYGYCYRAMLTASPQPSSPDGPKLTEEQLILNRRVWAQSIFDRFRPENRSSQAPDKAGVVERLMGAVREIIRERHDEAEAKAALRAALSPPPVVEEAGLQERRQALELAIELAGKEADEAMHVRRSNRDVVEGLERDEAVLKAMLAELELSRGFPSVAPSNPTGEAGATNLPTPPAGEEEVERRAREILNRHTEYMQGLDRGQRTIGTDRALAAVKEALSNQEPSR